MNFGLLFPQEYAGSFLVLVAVRKNTLWFRTNVWLDVSTALRMSRLLTWLVKVCALQWLRRD